MDFYTEPARKLTRNELIRNAKHNEYFGGGEWREVVIPDGVVCQVTRLWKAPKSS
jgi:hypothetical protein